MMIRGMTIAAALLLSGTALAQLQTDIPAKTDAAPAVDFVFAEAPDDHVIGSETAAQTIIIYASVTCPHCGDWFSEEWDAVKTGLVDTNLARIVFRELPTAPQQMSVTGFLLAECAPREHYFDIILYQMKNQDAIYDAAREGTVRTEYQKIAKMAGMEDDDAITACLRNPDMMAHIQASADRLRASGARGVPAFFINGERYDGETDAKTMVDLITDMDARGISTIPADAQSRKPAADHAGHDHE